MRDTKFNSGKKVSYLLIGGGIGAVLALLFAPKTGQEFRSDIAGVTQKGLDKTFETADEIGKKSQSVYRDAKTKAGEIYDSVSQTLNSVVESAETTLENAKNTFEEKSGQISSAIENGKKENKQSDKVLSQSTANSLV